MTDISALEAYAGQIAEAAVKSGAASEKQHEYIHGDDQSDVFTESGFVPSIAKQARLSAEGTAGLEGRMADPEQGAGLSAWKISKLTKAIENAGDALNHLEVP